MFIRRALGSTSHIYFATRAALTAPFGAGAEVTSLSDSLGERWASPSASGLFVILERNSKLYEASRAAKADPWGATVLPPELNEDAVAFPLTTGLPHRAATRATPAPAHGARSGSRRAPRSTMRSARRAR